MIKISRCLFGLFSFSVLALASCTDEYLSPEPESVSFSRSLQEVETPGGLIQQADGTWLSKKCRVPIVGPGRIVNEINNSTVNVIGVGQGSLENIVDRDLTNNCVIPVTVNASVAYTPIVSVKDMYHTYAAGQKVGFVYKDNEGEGATLLTLDLIKGMTLETYLNGKLQETVYASTDNGGVGLDLISFNTGGQVSDRVLAFDATKPFDEVRMCMTGVNASVAGNLNLAIKYAFVGENPEIRATSESEFSYYWTGGKPEIYSGFDVNAWTMTSVGSANNIVDDDIQNSSPTSSVLGAPSMVTVNFNRWIPVGTEIGYCYSGAELLGLGLFSQNSPTLIAYGEGENVSHAIRPKESERSEPDQSLLSVSLIGVTGKCLTNIVTTQECKYLKFQNPSKLLPTGGYSVYYAYVREPVKLDPVNYFTIGDDQTYNYAYALPTPEEGSVNYCILSSPYGSESSIQNGNKLAGMTKDGVYRVQALYTCPDGRQFSQVASISHLSVDQVSGCNRFITAQSHGAFATEPVGTTACLLCLFNGHNDLNNAVDNDPNNYAVVGEVAGVLEWNAVAAYKLNTPINPAGEKIRTGFIIQANSYLLDLSALAVYTIKLYKGETLVSESTTDDKASVNLGLLGFDQSKMRLSVSTDQSFDRIELWRKGVADVATSIRIYNLFYEPVACEEPIGGGGCMELMTNVKDGLEIDYPHTAVSQGLLSIASTATNLDYILDGDVNTGATLGSLVGASGTTIGLKFRKKQGNQTVGLILSGLGNIADVSLAEVGYLTVYNGDNKVASTQDVDILGVTLISEGDLTYIEVMPDEEFDRITFTTLGVQVLSASSINGVYYRPDSDGDGIPDCAETDDEKNGPKVDGDDFHICYGNPLSMPLQPLTPGATYPDNIHIYAYNYDLKENIECGATINNGSMVIAAKALPVGRYDLFIYSDEALIDYDIKVTVHPKTTTWKTNPQSTDWNDWDNWNEGSPWSCTDVILPSNAATYPELLSIAKNYCRNIHFEPGAEIVGTQYLNMGGKAFVDMSLQGGRYYLTSAPLQETFTGDMFISPGTIWDKSKYFTTLTTDNYKESRNRPIIYQHFWNSAAIEKDINLNETNVGKAEWSDDFNAVATRYGIGQGFLMRAGSTSDRNVYTFSFPKEHNLYTYYSSAGATTGKSESINRKTSAIGLFAMQTPGDVTLTNATAGKVFLMGNPTMSHIDIDKFIAANPSVSEVKVCKGRYYDKNATVESQTLSSMENNGLLVAPLSAFFIVINNEATSLTVKLTPTMLTQKHTLKKN